MRKVEGREGREGREGEKTDRSLIHLLVTQNFSYLALGDDEDKSERENVL